MNQPKEFLYRDLKMGEKAQFEVEITQSHLEKFAELSGDYNPLHTDNGYALQMGFIGQVAYGMLGGVLFSRLVGMELPGKFCLYLSQSMQFHAPIYPGTKVIVQGEIVQKVDAVNLVKVQTSIVSEDYKIIYISGEALVKLLK